MNDSLDRAATFIWTNARQLDRAIFEYYFCHTPSSRILNILRTYQNEDGGFGHALEPDLRAPDSHPLFVEFALRTLHDCNLHDPEMVYRVCTFLSQHTDLSQGIPTIFPSCRAYPRAPHWYHAHNEQPSIDRLVSLVGLVLWHGTDHPWLEDAVEPCVQHISNMRFTDAHTILNAFCLLEGLSQTRQVDSLYQKLSTELLQSSFFCLEAPVKTYGLTPLQFAASPDSYCRPIFTQVQIDAHLGDLQAQQQEDGGWPILWQPPGEMALLEWRANKTVSALVTLRLYGRI